MKKLFLLGLLMPATGMIAEKKTVEEMHILAKGFVKVLEETPREERDELVTPFTEFCSSMTQSIWPMVLCESYTVDPQEAERRASLILDAIHLCWIPLSQAAYNSNVLSMQQKMLSNSLLGKYAYALEQYANQMPDENADNKVEAEKTEFTEVSDNEESK